MYHHRLDTPYSNDQHYTHAPHYVKEYAANAPFLCLTLFLTPFSDIRVIFNADNREHAQERLKDFVNTYRKDQLGLAAWAEENTPEAFAVFALPEAHRKRMRTSNACETLNSQIKRRTRVVGLFPNEDSLLRLVSAVLIEISETWETGKSYLNLN